VGVPPKLVLPLCERCIDVITGLPVLAALVQPISADPVPNEIAPT
jgi:hypothetical protein